MTRRLLLAAIFLVGFVALYSLQRAKATAPISPAPILYLVADTEREAERIPLALTRISDEDENDIGDHLAAEYGLSSPNHNSPDTFHDDAQIEGYLNTVGSRLTQNVLRKGIHYHFYLEDDPYLINAYALPGGQIVVGRGLLNLLETEDELAAVLGHEITHVDNRHAIEKLQYELASRKIGLDLVYQIASPVVQLFEAGYSKEQELEADRIGVELAFDAGYSPEGGVTLMKRFAKLETQEQYEESHRADSPISEAAQVSLKALQDYFQSHPPAIERQAAIESEIKGEGWNAGAPQRPLAIRDLLLNDEKARTQKKTTP